MLAGCCIEMASFRCASCNASLRQRRARCRGCGWAVDYEPEASRRRRRAEVLLGVSLMVVCIVLAILVAMTINTFANLQP
jgi:hypothetical protein